MDTSPGCYPMKLIEKIHEYGDVYSLRFRPEEEIVFTPGMYAHVRIPDGGEGQRTREFSIASAPYEDFIQFTTHIWEGSPYKVRLGEYSEGDAIEVFKIKGDFVLPDDESTDVVFVAGGIGITPMRSMLLQSNKDGRASKPVLIHVAEGDHLFENELANLPNEQKRITRNEAENILAEVSKGMSKAQFYVSGPPGFVTNTALLLKNMNIDEENIHVDEFFGYEGVEV